MKECLQLIPQNEIPTHLLSLDSGNEKRHFFITKEQAQRVAKNINSDDQFISLVKEGIFFPKYKATCDLIKSRDIEQFGITNYEKDDIKREQDDKKRLEKRSKIEEWIKNNPKVHDDIWNKTFEEARENHKEIKEQYLNVLVKSQVNAHIFKLIK